MRGLTIFIVYSVPKSPALCSWSNVVKLVCIFKAFALLQRPRGVPTNSNPLLHVQYTLKFEVADYKVGSFSRHSVCVLYAACILFCFHFHISAK